MEPGIERSLREGFRAANASWPAIAVFAVGVMLVSVVTDRGVASTNPPPELFEEAPASVIAPPPDATVDELADAEAAEAEQARLALEWLGRAWPILLLCFLFSLAANTWLSGGQIGYLSRRVAAQPTKLSDFWSSSVRAFLPLLGAMGLLLAGALAFLVLLTGVGFVLSLLPELARALLSLFIFLGMLAALTWLVVRLPFWMISVVIDRLGPVAGMKAMRRTTRGRWWRAAGLWVLLVLIGLGILGLSGLLGVAGEQIGGVVGSVVMIVSTIAMLIAMFYLVFSAIAAYIRFYEDTKPAGGAPARA